MRRCRHLLWLWDWKRPPGRSRSGRLLVANIEGRGALGQFQATVHQIRDDDSARDFGCQKGHGEQILLALDQRLGYAVHRVAAGNAAGHLLDDECGHVELGVLLAVTDERAGDLFWGRQANVSYEVAVDGVREVEVENDAGEVSAVMEEDVEVANVAPVVEDGDETLVLRD